MRFDTISTPILSRQLDQEKQANKKQRVQVKSKYITSNTHHLLNFACVTGS